MFNTEHTLYVEKYRPNSLDSYIGNETIIETFKRYIQNNDVPHLLLYGDAGSGKTTLAKIVANTIAKDNYIYINASDENSIDTVRDKIKQFASSIGFGGLKIIILDESDYLTPNAQAALRNIMETFSKTTRFILTCNYVDKIIDPIQSRCQIFNITPPSKKEVAIHVMKILETESVEFSKEDLAQIINMTYPDIRRVLNTVQRCVLDSKLQLDKSTIVQNNFYSSITDILKSSKNKKEKFTEIRQIIADNSVKDYTPLFRYLYDNVEDYAAGFVSTVILIIADSQYKDSLVVDHEINAMAMFIQIIMEIDQRKTL
jgi:replication factor C small subunit